MAFECFLYEVDEVDPVLTGSFEHGYLIYLLWFRSSIEPIAECSFRLL